MVDNSLFTLNLDFSAKFAKIRMLWQVLLYWSKARPLQASFIREKGTLNNSDLDAHGDVLRGLQVVETSIGITSSLLGDKMEGMAVNRDNDHILSTSPVSKDMDTEVRRLPLGVCARSVS
jgi:hypothetical protein